MKKTSSLLVMLLSLFFGLTIAHADENTAVTIYPVYPENQTKGVHGFFSLEVGDRKKQDLVVELYNSDEEEKQVKVYITNALTTQNGGIQYVGHKGATYEKLLDPDYALSSYVETDSVVTLKPKEKKRITLKVTYPEKRIGTYLGGLLLENVKKETKKGKETTEQMIQIEQKTLYGIAIQFNFKQKEELNLIFKKPTVELKPGIRQVLVGIENRSANLIKDANIVFTVYQGEKKLFQGTNEDVDIAPKSSLYYPITWRNELIEAGDYQLSFTMSIDGKEEKVEENFTIEEEEIEKVIAIEKDIVAKPSSKEEKTKEKSDKVPFLILFLFILIIILFTYICIKEIERRKNERE